MKIRMGFVSNSSSSNFVVVFPRKPESVKDVLEIMFPGKKMEDNFPHPYAEWHKDCVFTYSKVVETVWHDIRAQKPNRKTAIYNAIHGGSFEGYPEWPTGRSKNEYAQWEEELDAKAKEIAEKFYDDKVTGYVYVFSYADENGSFGSLMEHGGIFGNLEHLRISCH